MNDMTEVPQPELIANLQSVRKTVRTVAGNELHILQDINLVIRPGEFVALVGPSGAGKTTLMNILGLLDTPTSGRYRLSGIDVATASERTRTRLRAQHLSFIFQAFHLNPEKTTADNVELGLACQGVPRVERRTRTLEALAAVGLADRATALSTTLSGGEQQRAAIARALARQSTLILADEPTGNLDADNAAAVIDLLSSSMRGDTAVVMVTHDPHLAKRADRTITLAAGRTVDPLHTENH